MIPGRRSAPTLPATGTVSRQTCASVEYAIVPSRKHLLARADFTVVTPSNSAARRSTDARELLAGALFVVGLGLVGGGGYVHFTMGDRTFGNCVETGVCNPWDLQWVAAPLAIGVVALLVGWLLYQQ